MSHRSIVDELLEEHGQTYAAEAGIDLDDEPAALFQLLVLTQLFSTRISADIAVAAARELFEAGWRT
ncbi:MAG TPA: endonuclease, partial [Nocardioidaceae bacterium]|nr:endonuclease [Nocardioidaceae bacterium]